MGRRQGLVRKAAGLVIVGAVALATHAAPVEASESTACTTRTVTKAFSRWGDNNNYFVFPGGHFEGSLPGWRLASGSSVVAGNDPWRVHDAGSHARSLRIGAGSSVTTPTLCVNSDEDSLRVVVLRPGVAGAGLRIDIDVVSGSNRATSTFTIDGSQSGWAVSERVMLPDIRDASGQQYTTIRFSTVNTPATWAIDNLMIDPWRTK